MIFLVGGDVQWWQDLEPLHHSVCDECCLAG